MDRNEIRRAWDAVAETYADRRDPSGSDADLIEALLEESTPEPVVLDIGCGDGARTLANLPDGAIGLDLSRQSLELAADTVPSAQLVQGEMSQLPVADRSIDAITAYYAVFHVPRAQQPAVYREFARVLRSGGMLLLTLPSGRFQTVRRGWMGTNMFFSAPGRAQTLEQLQAAGFEDLQTETVSDPLGSTSEFVFGTIGE